ATDLRLDTRTGCGCHAYRTKGIDGGARPLFAQANAVGAAASGTGVVFDIHHDLRILTSGVIPGIDADAGPHASEWGGDVVVGNRRFERTVRRPCTAQNAVALGLFDPLAFHRA